MQFDNEQQSLLEDEAFLLESRGVVRLRGKRAVEALQPLVTTSLDHISTKPVLAYVLDDDGFLMIDLFVVSHSEDLLIETDISFIPNLMELLAPHCEALGVMAEDSSSEWRVFAELPNQKTFDDGSPFLKYADPRWHMGARVLRHASTAKSSQWGREIKWATHALKLGFLPSAALLRDIRVSPLEAGLHALNLLDVNRLPEELQAVMSSSVDHLDDFRSWREKSRLATQSRITGYLPWRMSIWKLGGGRLRLELLFVAPASRSSSPGQAGSLKRVLEEVGRWQCRNDCIGYRAIDLGESACEL